MSVLDTVYRIFMFVLPFALCMAAYVWVGRKALRVSNQTAKIVALVIVAGGMGFTLYRIILTAGSFMKNELFEYLVIIVMVAVLALASIVMALGEPEK